MKKCRSSQNSRIKNSIFLEDGAVSVWFVPAKKEKKMDTPQNWSKLG